MGFRNNFVRLAEGGLEVSMVRAKASAFVRLRRDRALKRPQSRRCARNGAAEDGRAMGLR